MAVLKLAAFAFAVLAVFAALFGMLLPRRWHTERSVSIAAPSPAIYPLVASLRTGWPQWSPLGPTRDPETTVAFSGPDLGVGATESWSGGRQQPGTLRIVRADSATGIGYRLELADGRRVDGALAFSADPAGTRVTWTDDGDLGWNPFRHYAGKLVEESIAKGFEQGLAALKQRAEASAHPPAAPASTTPSHR